MRDASLEHLLGTLRIVAAGGSVLPAALTRTMFEDLNSRLVSPPVRERCKSDGLTHREREIMHLLGAGLSNKDIAARLGISLHTVKSHVHSVLEKLSLSSRLAIAAFSHSLRNS
jgi:DNA-binding NarL/FixJ family response regulator